MKRLQVFFTAAALAALLCLTGCKAKERVVMVETVRTDTAYITQLQRDSIYIQDSTHVSEQQRGDTLYISTTKWRTKYVERISHDTTYMATHDTIPQPYPVEVEVEKRLTWWQQTRLHLANIVLYALAIFVAVWAVRLWMRR